jgi:hypothetical protein
VRGGAGWAVGTTVRETGRGTGVRVRLWMGGGGGGVYICPPCAKWLASYLYTLSHCYSSVTLLSPTVISKPASKIITFPAFPLEPLVTTCPALLGAPKADHSTTTR